MEEEKTGAGGSGNPGAVPGNAAFEHDFRQLVWARFLVVSMCISGGILWGELGDFLDI